MAGRIIPDEESLLRAGYSHPEFVRRRAVLRETLATFSSASTAHRYRTAAFRNLNRWQEESTVEDPQKLVHVLSGDWGEVTYALTRQYGVCFAVLNMANAYVPGGGYVEGMPAQEENMFRRTDCHFHVHGSEFDEQQDRYLPEMTALVSAAEGSVYLDVKRARTCIRGPEIRSRLDLGYKWLAADKVFPFYELRAAAQDLRGGRKFDQDETRRRICAQLDTLREKNVRHAVLGAFGCGAFENPAHEVARLYKQEIMSRRSDFSIIAFAILSAGYGPDNYLPFLEVFGD